MKDLVNAGSVYRDRSCYTALYFDKTQKNVPPNLLEHAYFLPKDIRRLIMHILGYNRFGKIIEWLLDLILSHIDDRYSILQRLAEQLNQEDHSNCLDTQCRKVSQGPAIVRTLYSL